MIGLSFSFCFLDILKNKVDISKIDKIICGCRWENDEQFYNLVGLYSKTYWSSYTQETISNLIKKIKGKLVIPDNKVPWIGDGYWIEDESNVKYIQL